MTNQEWDGVLKAANESIAQVGSAVVAGTADKATREYNKEQAEVQRKWAEEQANKANAWNYEMWQKTNEYNSPEAQVDRLRDAGLNPLYYGLDGSSANGINAVQPLGYERANATPFVNPIEKGLQANNLVKDIELKNAQIDKLQEDTSSVKLDNEFKDKTMNSRVEGSELANSLTRKQLQEIDKKMDVMDEDIKLKIAQTDNEIEKKALIQAQKILAHAQASEIVYLLPFRQNLLEAQTEAQKAAASASYMHALYEKGLIDGGYIDSLCKEASNRAEASEYDVQTSQQRARMTGHEADIEKFKSSVRNGTLFKTDSWWSRAGNDVFGALSALSEALGGSLVPLIGGFAVGKATGSKTNVNVSGATPDVVAKQTAALGN